MDILRSVLINVMLNKLPDNQIRIVYAFMSSFCNGLTDKDALEPITATVIECMQTMTAQERTMVLQAVQRIKDHKEATV